MKAGSEIIRLVILMVFMMACAPLIQMMVYACNRSHMSYLDDKTVISSQRDSITARDYMLSLNAAQVLLLPEVNDDYCPSSGNVIFVKSTTVTRNNLASIRTNSVPKSSLDMASPNYKVRRGVIRNDWLQGDNGAGLWINSLGDSIRTSNDYVWIAHVNQKTTDSGMGMKVDKTWVISNVIPYGTW